MKSASAALAVSLVVDVASAAPRVVVIAFTHTESVGVRWRMIGF